jgi:hypothetical protein
MRTYFVQSSSFHHIGGGEKKENKERKKKKKKKPFVLGRVEPVLLDPNLILTSLYDLVCSKVLGHFLTHYTSQGQR